MIGIHVVFLGEAPLRLPRDEYAVRECSRRDLEVFTKLTRETPGGIGPNDKADELPSEGTRRPLDSDILSGAQASGG